MPTLPRHAGWALVLALYLLPFPYQPCLNSPNELCRLWLTRALVDHGSWEINPTLREHGMVGDLSCTAELPDGTLKPCVGPDAPRGQPALRHYYPSKAPLLSLAAVPVYAALREAGVYPPGPPEGRRPGEEGPLVFWARLFVTVLPTLAMLVFLRRFLATYLRPATADGLVLAYALGTLAYSYSLLFMSHQSTAVLLFGCFYALWRCARGEWRARGYVLAGAFAGATVAAEYTSALGVLALVAYAALSLLLQEGPSRAERWTRLARAAGFAALGALPFVALLAWYHRHAFGHPLVSGYKFLNDAAYMGWHQGGFLGIRTPDARALLLSLFSPLRGLLLMAPFLAAGLAGLRTPFRAAAPELRAVGWLTALLVTGYGYFTSSFSYDSWGWTTGPRHLAGLVPFLLLPAGLWLEQVPAWGRAAVAGLAAASVAVTGLSTFVNYVPDDVSEPVFGLAVPLLKQGLFVPSIPDILGLTAAAAGWLLVALLAAASALAALWLVEDAESSAHTRAMGLAAAVALGFLGLHAALAKGDHSGFLAAQWWTAPVNRATVSLVSPDRTLTCPR
ncbi:MAG: hypothetical protein FJ086_08905 [Deltaproteobacteria bacterium]|nr:hypothetical protein [Deltaproteobacteria bacterium]